MSTLDKQHSILNCLRTALCRRPAPETSEFPADLRHRLTPAFNRGWTVFFTSQTGFKLFPNPLIASDYLSFRTLGVLVLLLVLVLDRCHAFCPRLPHVTYATVYHITSLLSFVSVRVHSWFDFLP